MTASLAVARRISRVAALLPMAMLLFSACADNNNNTANDGASDGFGGDAKMGDGGNRALSDLSNPNGSSDLAGAFDLAGVNTDALGPAPVFLGTAGDYVILAKSAISTVPTSAITGDIGLSPAAATFITGFSMTKVGTYWTAPQIVGKAYAADNAAPTPTLLTTAVNDLQTAYTDAAGRSQPNFLNLGAGNIGGLTLVPGLYKWTSDITMPADVTLAGGANDVWILQTSGSLSMAASERVNLLGGAQAKNVFWQVAGEVNLGTSSHLEGIVLCETAIALGAKASISGRLLAQTAVSLNASVVTEPAE